MQRPNDVPSQPSLPQVAIIVAMTRNRVIGSGRKLPWHLPEELQLFKQLTMGCTIIMGRKTYTSIGHPLQGRHSIVLSRTQDELPGVQVCDSFIAGLTAAAQMGHPVFVIGGAELYRKALSIASDLHISWVKNDVPGDVFFPEFDLAEWSTSKEVDYTGFLYTLYRRKAGR
jgi:dihydrofolate reductase